MTRFLQLLSCLLLLAINPAVIPVASAADGPLINMPLPPLPANQEMLVLEVNLAPGQESAPHRHNAHVFVYVLEGQVNMQVAGGQLVTLGPGETFYENPNDIHAVSQNASATESARFLVHLIKTIGVPVSAAVAP
jgi:quercetin dioxygenase-like cupin family protein